MGLSYNAMLVYGIDFGDELPEAFLKFEEAHDYFEWDDWVELEEATPLKLVEYGWVGEEPGYILALKDSIYTTEIYYPKSLPDLKVHPKYYWDFKDFCKKYSIEFKEPKWLMCGFVW